MLLADVARWQLNVTRDLPRDAHAAWGAPGVFREETRGGKVSLRARHAARNNRRVLGNAERRRKRDRWIEKGKTEIEAAEIRDEP